MAATSPNSSPVRLVAQGDAAFPIRPGRCRVRLDSPALIAREMSRVYRAARAHRIPITEASSLVWMLATMVKVHADVLIDERVSALEATRG